MNYYFITGTSSGIGEAIVTQLLKDYNNMIYGFSRRNSIINERFIHSSLDLSNLDEVKKYSFPKLENIDKIVMINNAGTLGEIKHLGNLKSNDIITSFNVNITSVVLMCNSFINKYQTIKAAKIIINISSGAAVKGYDGWGPYCTTKAGINMITEVINKEQKFESNPIHSFAIAPGVVDTFMQSEIRKSNKNDFSNIEKFFELKSSGALYKAKDVAKQLISYCENPETIKSEFSRIEF